MERETGIEPATNSLEGCDSTTELLPPTCSPASPFLALSAGTPASFLLTTRLPTRRVKRARQQPESVALRLARPSRLLRAPFALAPRGPAMSEARRAESNGGEGRVRTSVARRRQVYSLLRLTALPPPRNHLSEAFRSGCGRDAPRGRDP